MTPSELGDAVVRTRSLVLRLERLAAAEPTISTTAILADIAEIGALLEKLTRRVSVRLLRKASRESRSVLSPEHGVRLAESKRDAAVRNAHVKQQPVVVCR